MHCCLDWLVVKLHVKCGKRFISTLLLKLEKVELQSIKKGHLSIDAYLSKIKITVDSLASVGHVLDD